MEDYDSYIEHQAVAVTSLPKIVSRKKKPIEPNISGLKDRKSISSTDSTKTTNTLDASSATTITQISSSSGVSTIKRDNNDSVKSTLNNTLIEDVDSSKANDSNTIIIDEATTLLKSTSTTTTTTTTSSNNNNNIVDVDKQQDSTPVTVSQDDALVIEKTEEDSIKEHFVWSPLSDKSSDEFDTFLEKRIKFSFKNGSKPREHQWRTIQSVVKDLAYPQHQSSFQNGKRYNYLIQHAAGSGKSLTIALLVYTLYKLEINNRLKFDTIVIMNDRSQLDAQLGDVIVRFLEANGIKNYCRPKTSKQLQFEIAHGKNRIVITTMQKFSQLLPNYSNKNNNSDNTFTDFQFKMNSVAIISDEAHRSHGKSTTERLHEFLVGNVKQTSQITYFSFTCTPTPQCLEMFGVSTGGRDKQPFYTYSMEDALKDNLILDVLENFKSLKLTGNNSNTNSLAVDDDYNWEDDYYDDSEEDQIQDKNSIQEKSIFILNHFLNMKKKYDTNNFKARGMVVCSGRKNLLVYKKTIDSIIEKLPPTEQFDTIAAFSPFQFEGKMILESDVSVNGKYAQYGADKNRGVVKAIQDDRQTRIKLLIVADKLQTGFDEPSLSMLYIDKKIKGANIVQTLSRLSRISNEKANTSIIDFINSEYEIKQVFNTYRGTTTLNDLQGEAFLLSKLQTAANNIKDVYAHERNVKSFAKSIIFHQNNDNQTYIDVEHDIQDFLSIYTKLERSEIVDIETPIAHSLVQSVKDQLVLLRKQQMDSLKENSSFYTIRIRIDTLTDLEAKNTLELSHQNIDYDADFAASLWADKKSTSPEKKRENTIQRLKENSKLLLGQQTSSTISLPLSSTTTTKPLMSSSFSYNSFGSGDIKKPIAKSAPNRSISVYSMASQSNLGKRSLFQPQFQPKVKKQKEDES